MSALEGCACRFGRDHDGSEFGPCARCEDAQDKQRETSSVMRDAARWRLFTDPLFFFVKDREADYGDLRYAVGLQPHPVSGAAYINHCVLARGYHLGETIDAMFLALDGLADQGAYLPPTVDAARLLASKARDAE